MPAARPKKTGTPVPPAPAEPRPAGWLYRSEPSVYSIGHLRRDGTCRWDGVRNYLARNFLAQARPGDRVGIWHSNTAQAGVAGFAKVVKLPYPDPTAFDPKSDYYDPKSDPAKPRWVSVDLVFEAELPEVLGIQRLRQDPAFTDLLFFRQNRLSVCPVQAQAWTRLGDLVGRKL